MLRLHQRLIAVSSHGARSGVASGGNHATRFPLRCGLNTSLWIWRISRAEGSAPKKLKVENNQQPAELDTPPAAVKHKHIKEEDKPQQGANKSKDFSDFYLIKSEPSDYSIDDLMKEEHQTTCWGTLQLRYNRIKCTHPLYS